MYSNSFIADLKDKAPGEPVLITGQYDTRRTHRDRVTISIKDITGTTFVAFYNEHIAAIEAIERFSRIKVWGNTGLSKDGRNIVIPSADGVTDLGSLKVPFKELGPEMREYAARMFVSRVTNSCAAALRDKGFDEFESKLISSEWIDGGLEPLQVLFPGFGNPATLITSPSAQVMDYLNATGVDKAFTVSTSFTTTYRHSNNAAETRVVVAKSVDLALTEICKVALAVCTRALDRLRVPYTDPPSEDVLTKWPAGILAATKTSSTLTIAHYGSDIVTGGTGWRNMLVENVFHVLGPTGVILIDGAIERIGQRTISTLSIYPARFLALIDADPPRRQLNDLNEYNSWHS